jgi:GTP cyclohydrolase I
MTIKGRKRNGIHAGVTVGAVSVVGIAVIGYLASDWFANVSAQVRIVPQHSEWIKNHERWTDTMLAAVLDKIKTDNLVLTTGLNEVKTDIREIKSFLLDGKRP